MNQKFWHGRKVFITGHTGFKGSWLSLWLSHLGAKVFGYSTLPPTEPNLFSVARIANLLAGHVIGDVRDVAALQSALSAASPEIVLHLAAQPLVRESYRDPIGTYATNVMGTVHLLEAIRTCPSVRAVVNVTTDKCYENKEWLWAYRESEPLGGRDPYSSSKTCSELVTAAYRASFLETSGVALASARAGNVIGGGDWAPDRLLPDFFRAIAAATPLEVRFPAATRPWQHVLEPLSGYALLAELLTTGGVRHASAFNFGPSESSTRTVSSILDYLTARIPNAAWRLAGTEHAHEAELLKLDSSKARSELGWRERWPLETALSMTVDWHAAWHAGRDMREVCLDQITTYDRTDAG